MDDNFWPAFIVIGVIVLIGWAIVAGSSDLQVYKAECRKNGGVPVDSGSKYTRYNCWSNETKGYIDIN